MTTLASTNAADRDLRTGMLIMAAAMVVIPGVDAFAKIASATVAPGQIAWSRFFFQCLFLAPLMLAAVRRRGRLLPDRLWLHLARGMTLSTATLLFFWGLAYLPLADAVALFFVEPFILTLLSVLFLGERVGWRRLAAISVGFAGALIIIQPSWAVFGWASVLPLGAAVCFAGYIVLTRRFAIGEGAFEMQFWAGLFGTLNLTLALLIGWSAGAPIFQPVWPTPGEWLLLAGCGAFATVGHVLVVLALRRAPAGLLAPLQYLEIISATFLGWWLFSDLPDGPTLAGIAIIVAAGLYVFHRERRRAAAGG